MIPNRIKNSHSSVTFDVAISVNPPIILPDIINAFAPFFLSTRGPRNGTIGIRTRRNKVMEEKAPLDTAKDSLIGRIKKANPYPEMPALSMLVKNVIATINHP